MRTVLLFLRGGLYFAVELLHVRRISTLSAMLQLPSPAEGVLGVLNDGNHVVPVIEAPLPTPLPQARPYRILLLNNGESPFGFQVEALEGPRTLRFVPAVLPELLQQRPALQEVPPEAIQRVHRASGVVGGPDFVVLVTPAPLYRARLLPEEG